MKPPLVNSPETPWNSPGIPRKALEAAPKLSEAPWNDLKSAPLKSHEAVLNPPFPSLSGSSETSLELSSNLLENPETPWYLYRVLSAPL